MMRVLPLIALVQKALLSWIINGINQVLCYSRHVSKGVNKLGLMYVVAWCAHNQHTNNTGTCQRV